MYSSKVVVAPGVPGALSSKYLTYSAGSQYSLKALAVAALDTKHPTLV